MPGTDDLEQAKAAAKGCVREPGVEYACVWKTEDYYNHQQVYEVQR